MLEVATHIFWQRLALFAGAFLIYDGYKDYKLNRNNKRALFRMLIGITTVIVDYIFLRSFGASIW